MSENHFEKAARILMEAAGGRATEPPGEIPKIQPVVSRVPVGNPFRLKEAYRNLARAIRDYIKDPSDKTTKNLKEMLGICSRLEPEYAPVQSPWFRPVGREDDTIFAKHREMATQASRLININRNDPQWIRCSELVIKVAKEAENER